MGDAKRDTAWAKQSLRDAGLRATAARVAVLKALASAGVPVSHADVATSLADFGFDQSTIFRITLKLPWIQSLLGLSPFAKRIE